MMTSRLSTWVLAARPKTLMAAAGPVCIGWCHSGWSQPLKFFPILLTALLLQILSNYSNDLFDGIRGSDSSSRQGPTRVIQAGLVSKAEFFWGIQILTASIAALGLLLYSWSDWPILLLGILAILCAIGYTAGPHALAYTGLGEVAVGIFFGPVAIFGTELILSGSLSSASLPLSLALATHAIAILLVNNIRDLEEDESNGKFTLSTKIGRQASIKIFRIALLIPYITILISGLLGVVQIHSLIVLLNMPLIFLCCKMIVRQQSQLNALLGLSSFALANFCFLYVAGNVL